MITLPFHWLNTVPKRYIFLMSSTDTGQPSNCAGCHGMAEWHELRNVMSESGETSVCYDSSEHSSTRLLNVYSSCMYSLNGTHSKEGIQ